MKLDEVSLCNTLFRDANHSNNRRANLSLDEIFSKQIQTANDPMDTLECELDKLLTMGKNEQFVRARAAWRTHHSDKMDFHAD